MANDGSARTGDDLKTYLRTTADDLRRQTGTRTHDVVAKGDVGPGATRYYGKQLEPVGAIAVQFYKDTEATGAFKGLSFSTKDYADAYQQMMDRKATEASLRPLYEDARAEALAARNRFALMTQQLTQTHRALMTSPGTDPEVKRAFKSADGHLTQALDGIRESRIASRESNSYVAQTEERLTAVETENAQLKVDRAAKDAQKDLRLQFLSGETLRPEDLVVVPGAASRVAPAQPTAPRATRRRNKRR